MCDIEGTFIFITSAGNHYHRNFPTLLPMDLPIQKYIGSAMRIKMVDDRVVDGVLTVVDPFGNLLLTNLYENSRDKIKTTSIKRREVGLVSIPRDRILKVMVDERQYNLWKAN